MSINIKMVFGILLILVTTSSFAREYRCGWLDNPTPANLWLTDNAGEWVISLQGGYHAKGIGNIRTINYDEFVRTNVNYGYSCVCLSVTTDKKKMRILKIHKKGKQKLLKACLEDNQLDSRR